MKQLFGFVLLVGVALLLLTIISGIGGVFTSIANTWQSEQTGKIGDVLADVLYFAGIVTVAVLGYGLFVNMSRGAKGWNGSRQVADQYHVIDAPQQPVGMLGVKEESEDWYDFEPANQYQDYPR